MSRIKQEEVDFIAPEEEEESDDYEVGYLPNDGSSLGYDYDQDEGDGGAGYVNPQTLLQVQLQEEEATSAGAGAGTGAVVDPLLDPLAIRPQLPLSPRSALAAAEEYAAASAAAVARRGGSVERVNARWANQCRYQCGKCFRVTNSMHSLRSHSRNDHQLAVGKLNSLYGYQRIVSVSLTCQFCQRNMICDAYHITCHLKKFHGGFPIREYARSFPDHLTGEVKRVVQLKPKGKRSKVKLEGATSTSASAMSVSVTKRPSPVSTTASLLSRVGLTVTPSQPVRERMKQEVKREEEEEDWSVEITRTPAFS